MAAFGRLWSEIAAELKLDPDNLVTRAIATRETWSGVVLHWPVDELSERLPIELSGLPVFDRDRTFRGYRGFGVCRDIARINELTRVRRERPIGFMPVTEAPHQDSDGAVAAPQADATGATTAAAAPAAETAEPPKPAAATVAAAEEALGAERPASSVPPGSANVVPFRSGPPSETKAPSLSPVERKAFRELAQELTSRLRGPSQAGAAAESTFEGLPAEQPDASEQPSSRAEAAAAAEAVAATISPDATPPNAPKTVERVVPSIPAVAAEAHAASGDTAAPRETATNSAIANPERQSIPAIEPVLLDRIPIAVLVYRHDSLLYANRRFLEWSGYENLNALAAAGGPNSLFVEPSADALADSGGVTQPLSIKTQRGDQLAAEGRLFTVPWDGMSALALVLTSGQSEERQRATERTLGTAESENRELKSILDVATDGIIVLDRDGRVISANAGATALFGKAAADLEGRSFVDMLAPESERGARDYLERLARGTNMLPDAIEVEATVREGRLIPLAMTLARISGDHFCAVFRDGTARKKLDEELRTAKREAQKAGAAKADFLAKVSHEIRTPLNAMTGFAEVIMAERFGPIGNERYREYLKDIHARRNASRLAAERSARSVQDRNRPARSHIRQCQSQRSHPAMRRHHAAAGEPRAHHHPHLADARGAPVLSPTSGRCARSCSICLSNSIKFTGPGGQVIVSTAFADNGEVVLRVRDTGVGMSEKDVEVGAGTVPADRHLRKLGFGWNRLGPAADQGVGRGQPCATSASRARRTPARWSRSRSRRPASSAG